MELGARYVDNRQPRNSFSRDPYLFGDPSDLRLAFCGLCVVPNMKERYDQLIEISKLIGRRIVLFLLFSGISVSRAGVPLCFSIELIVKDFD